MLAIVPPVLSPRPILRWWTQSGSADAWPSFLASSRCLRSGIISQAERSLSDLQLPHHPIKHRSALSARGKGVDRLRDRAKRVHAAGVDAAGIIPVAFRPFAASTSFAGNLSCFGADSAAKSGFLLRSAEPLLQSTLYDIWSQCHQGTPATLPSGRSTSIIRVHLSPDCTVGASVSARREVPIPDRSNT